MITWVSKTLHVWLPSEFWPIFRDLKSHNFLIVLINCANQYTNKQVTLLSKYMMIDVTVGNLQLWNLINLGIYKWHNVKMLAWRVFTEKVTWLCSLISQVIFNASLFSQWKLMLTIYNSYQHSKFIYIHAHVLVYG